MACYPLELCAIEEFALLGFPPHAIPPNYQLRPYFLRCTAVADHTLSADTQSPPSSFVVSGFPVTALPPDGKS